MSHSPSIRVQCLLVVLSVVTIGCGREGRLPTAVASPNELSAAAPKLDARDAGAMRGHRHEHLPPPVLIAEAKEGLGAVLTGEQVYCQKWGTFTDVPDTADFRVVLGVYLGDLLHRWGFSVSGASVTGFTATAQGRCDTVAEGFVVTLGYVRNQPPSWTVQRRGPCR